MTGDKRTTRYEQESEEKREAEHQEPEHQKIERYLGSVLGKPVRVIRLATLGGSEQDTSVKGHGYGVPVRVDYRAAGEETRSAVLHTLSPGQFGHEDMSDRAQILLWEHHAFNRLPRHVRSLDVGGFEPGGELIPLGKLEEFCLLTEYAEGQGYFLDLERLKNTGTLTALDVQRADALCDYLVEIHATKGVDPGLYVRRNRELVGHGECIMGLADSYPPNPLITQSLLEAIEHRCVAWRYKLKGLTHRLSQVHGDFHPWNILFGPAAEFRLLDRSRGEWGDPADDVACLTANYIFFSLQRGGRLEGALDTLFQRFWERYLDKSGDREMLKVVAPFFVFRFLVMASPVWYPRLAEPIRRKLLNAMLAMLDKESFDPAEVNAYCGV
jgi:hypothetical protein